MNWIEKITTVVPYTIPCVWNDGIGRTIDLEEFITDKSRNPENSYAQLLNKNRFAEVEYDGITLYWADGLDFEDYDGVIKKGPLDIAPEVLFELTEEGKRFMQIPAR